MGFFGNFMNYVLFRGVGKVLEGLIKLFKD